MNRHPLYAYALAILLGLFAAFLPANLPMESPSFATALATSSVVFAVVGLLLGLIWPTGGGRWAFWVVAPGLLLVTLGLVTSGNVASFLGDDLPFLVCGLVGAGLGGTLGARMSPRRSR